MIFLSFVSRISAIHLVDPSDGDLYSCFSQFPCFWSIPFESALFFRLWIVLIGIVVIRLVFKESSCESDRFDLVRSSVNYRFGSHRGSGSARRWRCSEGYFTGSHRIGFWRSLRGFMGQTFVLVDEEDYQPTVSTQLEDKLPGWIKETKIYFPSRNDPEAVELCYSDIKCLAPETYLSSTIMNFYIQYLQQQGSLTEGARGSYHFFNTYFYQKLKEAVSRKSDKETFFVKFRRWWKGVNIFEKAYIFLPIHEDLHWSLVIICIPDKEDESGPIILHLDSLGYHSSCQIFENIKRYIREEWNYLNQEVASLNIPIAERIWKHLPRRIDEKRITVPQQKNDYDCGLFVLFFMERFIEEAPGRLRKEDLAMFGRQWFKPEEASALRERIRILILEQFQNGSAEDLSRESSPAPSANASDENTKP